MLSLLSVFAVMIHVNDLDARRNEMLRPLELTEDVMAMIHVVSVSQHSSPLHLFLTSDFLCKK